MPPSSLSLKQRLAALSLASSAPSSPISATSPVKSPRKFSFAPPWTRRQPEQSFAGQAVQSRDVVQDVMGKMLFQAGVDFETRPMVVVNASALPDPREVNYDDLLLRILSYLNLYVESDYTVVFFAAGGKHTPGWNWVWKAYRSLSRKYRKHLKRLFIVHSTFFTKMLFSLAGAIIRQVQLSQARNEYRLTAFDHSPKFFRKITYISTLSELAFQVPLTQIDIPPAVYQENSKHERKITLPVPTVSSMFGVPLEDIMGYDGEKGGIPRVVKDAIQYLRETGMQDEGLFRRSPSSAMLKAAQDAYDRGNVVSLETFNDPHLAAVLLKKYLRDLPEPIFPESLYSIIRRCPPPTSDPTEMSAVLFVREMILPELPPCVYILLCHILHLMHEVSLRSASNRMDAHNLSLVLCPNLLSSSNPMRDVQMCTIPGGPSLYDQQNTSNPAALAEGRTTVGMVMKLCIWRYYEIFDEVRDRSEAVEPSRRGFGYASGANGRGELVFHHADSNDDSAQGCPVQSPHTIGDDDGEDIDDAMLVMPIGPSPTPSPLLRSPAISPPSSPLPITATTTRRATSAKATISTSNSPSAGPPSAWGGAGTPGNGAPSFKPRHRNTNSSSSGGVRSMHTMGGNDSSGMGSLSFGSSYYASNSKARSLISIEKGSGSGTLGGRKGSISIGTGRGTVKGSGAGVEAIGITAAGFFTAPSSAPSVPPLPPSLSAPAVVGGTGES